MLVDASASVVVTKYESNHSMFIKTNIVIGVKLLAHATVTYLKENMDFNVLVENMHSAASRRLGVSLKDVDLRRARKGEDNRR